MAIVAGLLLATIRRDIALPLRDTGDAHGHTHDADATGGMLAIPGRILGEFFELFQFLVVGAALAAFVQVFVDQSFLTSAQGVYLSIIAMMALAFLLSICSSVDAFVVAGLGGGLGTGPILAFLVFGPLINLKNMPLYLRLFTAHAVVLLTVVVTQLAFAGAVIAELRAW
jgi:uncharacterized membrane protein YraQ (UPF0718 family)